MAKGVPEPKRLTSEELARQARALTFFVTVEERERVLKRLKRVHADRRVALLRALGITGD